MSNVAAKVRRSKEKDPSAYCPNPRCLWKTHRARGGAFTPCPKHQPEKCAELAAAVAGRLDEYYAERARAADACPRHGDLSRTISSATEVDDIPSPSQRLAEEYDAP